MIAVYRDIEEYNSGLKSSKQCFSKALNGIRDLNCIQNGLILKNWEGQRIVLSLRTQLEPKKGEKNLLIGIKLRILRL